MVSASLIAYATDLLTGQAEPRSVSQSWYIAVRVVRGPDAPVMYSPGLVGAVAAYQARHGLVADSVIGASTLESLNRSADFRLCQIAANLERHRSLPRERGDRFVVANVPSFR